MAHAYTTHRIVPHGRDRMVLTDCTTGQGVVEAVRDNGNWVVTAGEVHRVVPCGDRRDPTITAMNQMAFQAAQTPWITIKEPHRHASTEEEKTHPNVYRIEQDGVRVPVIHIRGEA